MLPTEPATLGAPTRSVNQEEDGAGDPARYAATEARVGLLEALKKTVSSRHISASNNGNELLQSTNF